MKLLKLNTLKHLKFSNLKQSPLPNFESNKRKSSVLEKIKEENTLSPKCFGQSSAITKFNNNIIKKIKSSSKNYNYTTQNIKKIETLSSPLSKTFQKFPLNINIRNNSITNSNNHTNSRINTISTNNISTNNHKNSGRSLDKKCRNVINFKDRNRIKASKTIDLELLKQFEEEGKETNFNKKINFRDSMFNNLGISEKEINIKSRNKISNNKNNIFRNSQYSLKELIQLNPYHSVSKMVKYCNTVQMKKISEQLSRVNGINYSREATSKARFFLNDKEQKNKKNIRLINTYTVYFNDENIDREELVWRILNKLQKSEIPSAFRQACKFKGYFELWKHYNLLIETLLVNYYKFKWFLEKEKFLKEEVFVEFLHCMRLGKINISSFPRKIFLLFDDKGLNAINPKLFFFIFKITSKICVESDKYNFILYLCEDINKKNYEKSINVFEVIELFKHILLFENVQRDTKILLEKIRAEFNNDETISQNLYISKNQLYNFLINNKFIKRVIKNFNRSVNEIDLHYNEEINSCFNSVDKKFKKYFSNKNEIVRYCVKDFQNYEFILNSVQNKLKKIEKNKEIEESFAYNDDEDEYSYND